MVLAVVAYVAYRLLQPSPDEVLETALEQLPAQGSVDVTLEAEFVPGTSLADVVADGAGTYNDSGSDALTFDFSDVPNAWGALGNLGEFETIYEGSSFYSETPQLSSYLDIDDPWIKFDPDDVSLDYGADIGAMRAIAYANPDVILHSVREGSKLPSDLGSDELDGEDADRIGFDIDIKRAGSSSPPELERIFTLLKDDGGAMTAEGEVWIVEDSIARMRVTLDMLVATGAPTRTEVTFTLDFSDATGTTDIELPPAGATVELEELVKGLAGKK